MAHYRYMITAEMRNFYNLSHEDPPVGFTELTDGNALVTLFAKTRPQKLNGIGYQALGPKNHTTYAVAPSGFVVSSEKGQLHLPGRSGIPLSSTCEARVEQLITTDRFTVVAYQTLTPVGWTVSIDAYDIRTGTHAWTALPEECPLLPLQQGYSCIAVWNQELVVVTKQDIVVCDLATSHQIRFHKLTPWPEMPPKRLVYNGTYLVALFHDQTVIWNQHKVPYFTFAGAEVIACALRNHVLALSWGNKGMLFDLPIQMATDAQQFSGKVSAIHIGDKVITLGMPGRIEMWRWSSL